MTTIMPTAGLCDTEPDRRQPPAPHTDQTETHSHTRTPDLNEVGAYLAAMATAAILALVHMVVIDLWGRTENAKLRDLLMKWDSAWLTGIADSGYLSTPGHDGAGSVAFFPGYPILVRMVGAPLTVFGVDHATLIAGLIVSLTATMAAAWGLARLALRLHSRLYPGPVSIGTGLALAVSSAVLAFGAPMAVVYGMPYSEALFTALAVWAIVMILERRYLAAGILVMFAGTVRLTAPALIATLAVCAIVELWRYRRERRAPYPTRFPWAALTAPLIGSLGLAGYLAWANTQTSSSGGYFGVQDAGWGSAFDWGASTWRWVRDTNLSIFGDPTSAGYAVSSWSMIAVAALAAACLWPTVRRRVPWQLTSTALLIAAIVLGSGGIMHSRPRLLLLPVLLLLLPTIVRAVGWTATRTGWRRLAAALGLVIVAGAWCAIGLRTSGHMLIEFPYGI